MSGIPIDPMYEVDAPKFYDFNNLSANSSKGDSWFEQHIEESLLEDLDRDDFQTPMSATPAVNKTTLKDITNTTQVIESSTRTILKNISTPYCTPPPLVKETPDVHIDCDKPVAPPRVTECVPEPNVETLCPEVPKCQGSSVLVVVAQDVQVTESHGDSIVDCGVVDHIEISSVIQLSPRHSSTPVKDPPSGVKKITDALHEMSLAVDEQKNLLSSAIEHPNQKGKILEASKPVPQKRSEVKVPGSLKRSVTSGPAPQKRGRSPLKAKPPPIATGGPLKAFAVPVPQISNEGERGRSANRRSNTTNVRPFSFDRQSVRRRSPSGTSQQGNAPGPTASRTEYGRPSDGRKTPQKMSNRRTQSVERKATLTKPKPFAFEERDKNSKQKMEQWRNDQLSKEQAAIKASRFHASPVPNFDVVKGPRGRPPLPTTKPITPQFLTDKIVANYKEKEARYIKEQEAKAKAVRQFHARPADVLKKRPFTPEKNVMPKIKSLPVKFALEERREHWRKMSEEQKQKQEDLRKLREKEMSKKEEEEKRLKEELRRKASFKANPVQHYSRMPPRPPSAKLTVPETPQFAKNRNHDPNL